MLSDLQTTYRSRCWINQQILHLFVINFDHRDHNLKLHRCRAQLVNTVKNFIAGNRYNADIGSVANLHEIPCHQNSCGTYHWVRFTSTCLSVREQTTVVAFPGIVEDLLAERVIDEILISVAVCGFDRNAISIVLEVIMGPKGVVECEGTFSLRRWIHDNRLFTSLIRVNQQVCLPFWHRPNCLLL